MKLSLSSRSLWVLSTPRRSSVRAITAAAVAARNNVLLDKVGLPKFSAVQPADVKDALDKHSDRVRADMDKLEKAIEATLASTAASAASPAEVSHVGFGMAAH